VDPTCGAAGALAFTSLDVKKNIWLLPFDLDRGMPRGPLQRLTQGPAARVNPSLSKDGRSVAFLSNQSGPGNIWVRELATGKEQSVANSLLTHGYPVSNATGTQIAFSVYENDMRVVYVSTPGGTPEKVCEGCLRATDWSRDEKSLLVFGGNPYHVNLLDVSSHQQTPLLKHSAHKLLYARFSPDNRWVSFTARIDPSRGRIMIAPIDRPKPVPESTWITIAETAADDYAEWSPDGRTLYFTSGRDGHNCLWGQRLDPDSCRPIGEPFAVQHLHGLVAFAHEGWSAAGNRIGLALAESAGNIWIMSPSSAH
jgi:Tol biopolymer transport system component